MGAGQGRKKDRAKLQQEYTASERGAEGFALQAVV